MKFSEIIDRLNEGKAVARFSSPAWAGKFIVKQLSLIHISEPTRRS